MSRIGDETPLLAHQVIHPRQQTVDGMHERRDLIREIIVGQRKRPIRRLLVQTSGQPGYRCKFTADDTYNQPCKYRKKE